MKISKSRISSLLSTMLHMGPPGGERRRTGHEATNVAGVDVPAFSESELKPESVDMRTVVHPDGRMSQYPPSEKWDDWVEWDGKLWPQKVARRYTLVPTVCFNCESACGLLAYVDKTTFEIKKFEGNPAHPGQSWPQLCQGACYP